MMRNNLSTPIPCGGSLPPQEYYACGKKHELSPFGQRDQNVPLGGPATETLNTALIKP